MKMPNSSYLFPPNSSQFSPSTIPYIPIIILGLLFIYTGLIATFLLLKKFVSVAMCCPCKDRVEEVSCPSCLEGMKYTAERCNIDIPSPSSVVKLCTQEIRAACKCNRYLGDCSGSFQHIRDGFTGCCQCYKLCDGLRFPECKCNCTTPECNEINCGCFTINFNN